MKIKLINLTDNKTPAYQTDGSVGVDLHANIKSEIKLSPYKTIKIPTGIKIELPKGIEAQIRGRSGLAMIGIVAHVGTIDSDYRGEICAIITNISDEPYTIMPNSRIAQLIFNKVEIVEFEEVSKLDETARGIKGFGSTGV